MLQATGHHFGYRVAYEMAAYILNAANYVGDDETTLTTALDLQVLQKVLPKFHGTTNQIEVSVARLLRFCIDRTSDVEGDDPDDILGKNAQRRVLDRKLQCRAGDDADWEFASLPRAGAKLYDMLSRLRTEGFTSFIQ